MFWRRRVLNFFNLFWYFLICTIVEIGWVFRGKKIYFILSMCISLFRNIFPGKERGPSFEETWIPFTQGCFVPRFVEIDPLNMKMWKVYRRTTDNQKSSLEFSAQVSLYKRILAISYNGIIRVAKQNNKLKDILRS